MAQPKLSGDNVRAYLRDIGRIPLLEHEEEILLGRKVQRLMTLLEMKDELSLDNDGLADAMDVPLKQIKKELRDGPHTACWTYVWLKVSDEDARAAKLGAAMPEFV